MWQEQSKKNKGREKLQRTGTLSMSSARSQIHLYGASEETHRGKEGFELLLGFGALQK